MKNNPAKASPPAITTDLNQIGVDVMPSRDEMAKKAYFLHLNQTRPQGRNVQVEWWEAGAQIIECHRDVRVGACGSPPKPMLLVFRRTP